MACWKVQGKLIWKQGFWGRVVCGGRDAELVGDYAWPVEYQLIGWTREEVMEGMSELWTMGDEWRVGWYLGRNQKTDTQWDGRKMSYLAERCSVMLSMLAGAR